MRGQSWLDDVAGDLASWIDNTADEVARAFAPARAPFSAQITEDQKLAFYKSRIFNPDGSPNQAGRQAEIQRLGAEGFGHVYEAVLARFPELRPPPTPEIEVPEQWPGAPPMGGPTPLGPPTGPGGIPSPGPPMMPPPGVPAMAQGGIVTEPTLALIGEAGPEAVVPLKPPQWEEPYSPPQYTPPPNLVPSYAPASMQPQVGRAAIEAYITQAAQQRGIDPSVALRVAQHEGLAKGNVAEEGRFETGKSYWPFQLHYGGPGYEHMGTTAGLGNDFTAATGYQPGDPNAWQPSVDFALDTAVQRGWYPTFYGSEPARVARWQGLPQRRA